MKNSLKSIYSLAFIALFTLIFASCEKENLDIIVEEPEEITIENIDPNTLSDDSMIFEFRGARITTNAYATYCNANGREFMSVSNNPSLVGSTAIDITAAQPNDFLLYQSVDSLGNTFSIGTMVYEDTTQTPALTIIALSDAPTITISSANSSNVVGRMTGSFLNINALTTYNVVFNASVTAVSPFCN